MPYWIQLDEKRRELNQLHAQAKELNEKALIEKRDFSVDEQKTWDDLNQRMDRVEKEMDQFESLARREAKISAAGELFKTPATDSLIPGSVRQQTGPNAARPEVRSDEYAKAFVGFLRYGPDKLALRDVEQRATLQADNDAGGGFFAASERLIQGIIRNAMAEISVGELIRVIPVAYGQTLGAITLTGTPSAFTFAGELTTAEDDEDIEFGKRELKPKDLKRKTIPISNRLLENDFMDVEQFVQQLVGEVLGESLEDYYCNGTGDNQPLGLFVASDDGIPTSRDVSTDNLATSITADNLIEVTGSLKSAYLTNARWLFNRTTITKIRKLKDGMGQYIWQPGLLSGVPQTILGYPYRTSDKVPSTFTENSYVGMFADFNNYWCAWAMNMSVQRLDQYPYANKGQIALLFDRMAIDAQPQKSEAFTRIKLAA